MVTFYKFKVTSIITGRDLHTVHDNGSNIDTR